MGQGGVGKSCLTQRFIVDRFVGDAYSPTVEDKYTKHLEVNGQAVFAEILDTAGQDQYSDLRPHFLPHGDAFVLVYAINDNETFEKIDEFYDQIFRVNPRAAQLPFILIGNKCDMEDERRVEVEEGQEKKAQLEERGGNVIFIEASAKNDVNVDKAFRKAISMSLELNTSSETTHTSGVMGAGSSNTYESGNSIPKSTKSKASSVNVVYCSWYCDIQYDCPGCCL